MLTIRNKNTVFAVTTYSGAINPNRWLHLGVWEWGVVLLPFFSFLLFSSFSIADSPIPTVVPDRQDREKPVLCICSDMPWKSPRIDFLTPILFSKTMQSCKKYVRNSDYCIWDPNDDRISYQPPTLIYIEDAPGRAPSENPPGRILLRADLLSILCRFYDRFYYGWYQQIISGFVSNDRINHPACKIFSFRDKKSVQCQRIYISINSFAIDSDLYHQSHIQSIVIVRYNRSIRLFSYLLPHS